jgi:hypothetical protein
MTIACGVAVVGERHRALDVELEPAQNLVVADGGHLDPFVDSKRSFRGANPCLQSCDQPKACGSSA